LLTVKDVDSATLDHANVTINGYVNGEDTLSFVTAPGITGLFNTATGTIAFTGVTSAANYETTLRSLKYTNSSSTPTTTTRTIQITVNDGLDNSLVASRSIQVTSNTPPVIVSTVATLNYSDNQGAAVVDSGLTITDSDSPNIATAKVTIGGYVAGEDFLAVTNPQTGINPLPIPIPILPLRQPLALSSFKSTMALRIVTSAVEPFKLW
jgi:large repetitive protein